MKFRKEQKTDKEQKPNAEIMRGVDVELNEEQLEVVSGGVDGIGDVVGIVDDGSGGGCTGGNWPFNKTN
jgi:hypothetical protein